MEWRLRPARDLGLTFWQRIRSHLREPGLASHALHEAWLTFAGLYLRAVHRLRVQGRENIPEPPFVMVANHASFLDAPCLTHALPRRLARRAYALAAGDFFFDTLATAGVSALAFNALPVWRKGVPASDLAMLRQRMEEDRLVLILFPEGTRSRSGVVAPFKAGVGALVAGSAVPVLPCWIDGAYAAWPPDRRLPRPLPLGVAIGQPLSFADATNDRAGWTRVAAACERAVRSLRPLTAVADSA